MCLDALVGGSQRGLEKGHAHSIFRRIRANGRSKHGEISSRLGKGRTRLFDRGGFRGFRGSRPSLQEHGRVRRFSITRSEGKQYAKLKTIRGTKIMKSLNRVIGALALLIWGLTLGASGALAQNGTLPKFGHVIIVLEENTDYSNSIGSNMPYLTSLYSNTAGLTGLFGGLATNYNADTHPSIGNYFTITTGEILTNDDGKTP